MLIATGVLLIIHSCGPSNPYKVDTNAITVDVKVKRFEQDLFALKGDSVGVDQVQKLQQKYPVFFPVFVEDIIMVGAPGDPAMPYYLNFFMHDKQVEEVYPVVEKEFSGFEEERADLNYAFKHYRYYFPERQVPDIVTFYSHFNYPLVVLDSTVAVPLEKYLGSVYDFYDRLNVPAYKIPAMSKKGITVDCLLGWVNEEFSLMPESKEVIDQMIYHGKLFHTLDYMLPDWHDSLKIGYTGDQVRWCYDNEVEIWRHLVQNQILFSTEPADYAKFIGEGPFTPGFPEGSPGKIGQWVGWQIVRAYMKNNPQVSLQELLEEKDLKKILNKSGYKPNN